MSYGLLEDVKGEIKCGRMRNDLIAKRCGFIGLNLTQPAMPSDQGPSLEIPSASSFVEV
jgi:hypothetical protein